jgi:DNA-binding beta-propeller fold protein YncE
MLSGFLIFMTIPAVGFAATLSTGMAASYVLCQSDFESNTSNTTLEHCNAPSHIAYDAAHDRLFVSDSENYRVLVYDTSSGISTGMNPVNVLGQSDFTTNTFALDGLHFKPKGLVYDATGNRLFVADSQYNRVLVFDVASITDGESAAHVLGQATFSEGTANAGTSVAANNLHTPEGLTYDSARGYLIVADSSQRVLIFDVNSITDGEDAIYVLGQPDFETGNSASGLAATGMNYPLGVDYDAGSKRLFVADSNYRRVLVFDLTSITDNEPAVHVLGQEDFETNTPVVTQDGMSSPSAVAYDPLTSRLFVTDADYNRVLVFDLSGGITDGMNASFVLGQDDFTSSTSNSNGVVIHGDKGDTYLACDTCVASPSAVKFDTGNNYLYVADSGNGRILIFDLGTGGDSGPGDEGGDGSSGIPSYAPVSGTISGGTPIGYAPVVATQSASINYPKLVRGDRGAFVQKLQTLLGIRADGIFGPATHKVVKIYQASHGLVADGIVGKKTWAVLLK